VQLDLKICFLWLNQYTAAYTACTDFRYVQTSAASSVNLCTEFHCTRIRNSVADAISGTENVLIH